MSANMQGRHFQYPTKNVIPCPNHLSMQRLVDGYLVGSRCIIKAAIFDETGAELARSPNFSITEEEVKQLMRAITKPWPFRRDGISMEGILHRVDCADGHRGLMASYGVIDRNGIRGFSACRTARRLVVGLHDASVRREDCNLLIMTLGDKLDALGF